jgi:hypothetical protein
VPGLELELADERLPNSDWGKAVPRDPGSYRLLAQAKGYHPFERTITVPSEPGVVRVEVAPLAANGNLRGEEKPRDRSTARTVGWTLVAVGVAFGVAGGAMVGVGSGKRSDAKAVCPDLDACDDSDARSLGVDGANLIRGGAAVLALGGAALLTSALLLAVGYSADDPESARIDFAPLVDGRVGGGVIGLTQSF